MGTYYDSKNEKARFYRGTSKDPYHLFVAQITDLLSCENCTEIESIYYSYKLKELPIPFTAIPIDYSKFPNLEELNFGFPVSWDYIASLDIPRIKKLSFCLDGGRVTKKMVFENLIDLDISFSHLYQSNEENEQPTRQRFDFSGVPNVHSIRLKYAEYFDYDSLKNLKELRSLSVQDKTLDELSWLKNVPQLRTIQLLGNLDDLTSIIEYQPKLKRLNINELLWSNNYIL